MEAFWFFYIFHRQVHHTRCLRLSPLYAEFIQVSKWKIWEPYKKILKILRYSQRLNFTVQIKQVISLTAGTLPFHQIKIWSLERCLLLFFYLHCHQFFKSKLLQSFSECLLYYMHDVCSCFCIFCISIWGHILRCVTLVTQVSRLVFPTVMIGWLNKSEKWGRVSSSFNQPIATARRHQRRLKNIVSALLCELSVPSHTLGL